MDKPITSYIQVLNIIVYFVGGGILIVTLGRVRLLFWEQGAMTAILLIFKDTILGFVAANVSL
jgi:miniconductance mechanosensitive channel